MPESKDPMLQLHLRLATVQGSIAVLQKLEWATSLKIDRGASTRAFGLAQHDMTLTSSLTASLLLDLKELIEWILNRQFLEFGEAG